MQYYCQKGENMTIEAVRIYLKDFGKDNAIIELEESSATVELAAKALGVIPARIAKTLSFKVDDKCVLIVTAGDTKIDNRKFKEIFHTKAKMLTPEEVIEFTGHAIGGVCPFGLKDPEIKTYCDISMKRFETIFPACGSQNSAIELTCDELFTISKSCKWIDTCK